MPVKVVLEAHLAARTVVLNARIRTLDDRFPEAQALAISGGSVSAVGDNSDIAALADSSTLVIDAGRRTVLPSFIDSHMHLRRASLMVTQFLDFTALRPASVADVLRLVGERALKSSANEWIQGDSLIPAQLAERRFPDRRELDAAAPDNPVVLRGIGRHVIAANSLALRIAGIDKDAVSPSGGRIERDADGCPTGILHGQAKMRLDNGHAQTVVPSAAPATRAAALRQTMTLLNSYGISCIHEMAREPTDVSEYLKLKEAGGLTSRVRILIRGIEAQTSLEQVIGLGLRSGFGDDWIRLEGVKFSIDGIESLGTAALYIDYPGQPGNRGIVRIEARHLTDAVAAAHRAGLQVAIHAVGQRAVDMALDAYEAAQQSPNPHLRHRLEHAYLPPERDQMERIARLGLIWSTQPSFLTTFGEVWRDVFGAQRAEEALPLRSAMARGIPIQLNSDFPSSPMNPFATIKAAVTRRTNLGRVLNPGERLTVDQAVRGMTGIAGGDGAHGRIAPGCRADMILLDQDPYVVPPDELEDIRVDTTLVGGEVVYSRHGT